MKRRDFLAMLSALGLAEGALPFVEVGSKEWFDRLPERKDPEPPKPLPPLPKNCICWMRTWAEPDAHETDGMRRDRVFEVAIRRKKNGTGDLLRIPLHERANYYWQSAPGYALVSLGDPVDEFVVLVQPPTFPAVVVLGMQRDGKPWVRRIDREGVEDIPLEASDETR